MSINVNLTEPSPAGLREALEAFMAATCTFHEPEILDARAMAETALEELDRVIAGAASNNPTNLQAAVRQLLLTVTELRTARDSAVAAKEKAEGERDRQSQIFKREMQDVSRTLLDVGTERDALNAALVEQTEKLATQTLVAEMAEAKRIDVTAERDAALKSAEAAEAEVHLLDEVCATYATDEDRYQAVRGEPYGSIPTEIGIKARVAQRRFLERKLAALQSGAPHDH